MPTILIQVHGPGCDLAQRTLATGDLPHPDVETATEEISDDILPELARGQPAAAEVRVLGDSRSVLARARLEDGAGVDRLCRVAAQALLA